MKKLFALGSFLVFAVALCAQNNYFIFIQSENNQPYYVHTGGKTLSSSSIGHLIIPGLRDSIYSVSIGFPKSQFGEQSFDVPVNKKDGGYQLKNLGAEGWALENMQTLQLVRSQQSGVKKPTIAYGDVKKTDNFSMLMAGLVNDSAVLYTSIVKASPPKENTKAVVPDVAAVRDEPVKAVEEKDSSTTVAALSEKSNSGDSAKIPIDAQATRDPETKPATPRNSGITIQDSSFTNSRSEVVSKNETVQAPGDTSSIGAANATPAPNTPSDSQALALAPRNRLIVSFSETKTTEGIEMVFFDLSASDRTDTIRILIPMDTQVGAKQVRTADSGPATPIQKSDSQKDNSGFFGKLFRKKESAPTAEENSSAKQSTITVTTVEKEPNRSLPTVKNDASGAAGNRPPDTAVDTSDSESGSKRGVFNKLFGKKNNQEGPAGESRHDAPSSAVKSPPAERSPSQDNTASKRSPDSDETTSEEVSKLRKAQEQEEKTSTERFFGRIFKKRKKEDHADSAALKEVKSDEVSITVKDVPTSAPPDTGRSAAKEKAPVILNSDCSSFATDSDIDRLKIKLLSRKDIDAQIVEARKFFKTKCLSTNQVKALSTLYRTDAEKYRLFDASYPFVSDSGNFMDLVVLLNEPYYINRFIAMVRM